MLAPLPLCPPPVSERTLAACRYRPCFTAPCLCGGSTRRRVPLRHDMMSEHGRASRLSGSPGSPVPAKGSPLTSHPVPWTPQGSWVVFTSPHTLRMTGTHTSPPPGPPPRRGHPHGSGPATAGCLLGASRFCSRPSQSPAPRQTAGTRVGHTRRSVCSPALDIQLTGHACGDKHLGPQHGDTGGAPGPGLTKKLIVRQITDENATLRDERYV